MQKSDDSGLMYMRNRYYNPATGSFTQEDPIGIAGGLNTYGFANGDPATFSDPYGLAASQGGVCDWANMAACIRELGAKVTRGINGVLSAIGRGASDLSGISDVFISATGRDLWNGGKRVSGGDRALAIFGTVTPLSRGQIRAGSRRSRMGGTGRSGSATPTSWERMVAARM